MKDMKNIKTFAQFESESGSNDLFYAVFRQQDGELIAFFNSEDDANDYIQAEIDKTDLYDKVKDELESKMWGMDIDWDEEIQVRLYHLAYEIYSIEELFEGELMDSLAKVPQKKWNDIFSVSDLSHVSRERFEKTARGKGMFGV